MPDSDVALVALAVGLLLIFIPEPATTATGMMITTASVGVEVADNVQGGGA
jgi:hypothetical protein